MRFLKGEEEQEEEQEEEEEDEDEELEPIDSSVCIESFKQTETGETMAEQRDRDSAGEDEHGGNGEYLS